MNVVITGGAGFLGARLARTLLAQGQLALAALAPQPISRITLVDRAQPPADLLADIVAFFQPKRLAGRRVRRCRRPSRMRSRNT